MTHAKAETAGQRLYQVRLACGDGVRKPETMEAFAERVKAETGKVYDPSTVSLLERDMQRWKLEDVRAFAAVDPLKRGEVWLSALSEELGPDQFVPAPGEHGKRKRRDGRK